MLPTVAPPTVRVAAGIRFPLLVFAVWRLLHAAAVLAAGGSLRGTTFSWDAGWYLSILRSGYVAPAAGYGAEESNLAFFPGLAWLTEAVQVVVRDETVAAVLVVHALALTAFVSVWGAVRAWAGEPVARRATVALALFPTSYFLWMYYTEALLVSATAAAAWAARRERHHLATLVLALAATARLVGVTVGPALALARIVRLRRVDAVSVGYVLGSLAGLAAVMTRQGVEGGDPLGFLKAGEAWGRETAAPWTALVEAAKAVVAALPGIAGGVLLDLLAVLVVGVLLVLLWRGARSGRRPLEPAAVTTALFLVPISSSMVASQVRYMLACWPVLLVVGDGWPRLPRAVRVLLVAVPVALTVLLLRRLSLGLFTG